MTIKPFDPTRFIDREFEQEIFEGLLRLDDYARVLTICDKGGMGKSQLLEKFQYRCRVAKPRIPVCLVSLSDVSDGSPLTFIRAAIRQLETFGVAFPNFKQIESARVSADFMSIRASIYLEGASFKDARDVRIGGTMINLDRAEMVEVRASSVELTVEQERIARDVCIKAFFDDLRAACAERTIVLLIDAYERGAGELHTWLIEQLFEQLVFDLDQRPARLVLVVAGRELPHFAHYWASEECARMMRSVQQLSQWQRHHVEECLRIHGFRYSNVDVDMLHHCIQRGVPPSQVIQIIQSMLMAGTGTQ
jgi:hypothetical protein